MINNAYDNYKATGQNLNDYFRQFGNVSKLVMTKFKSHNYLKTN